MRLPLMTAVATLAIAACADDEVDAANPAENVVAAMEEMADEAEAAEQAASELSDDDLRAVLAEVTSGDQRAADAAARDQYRNPAETILFFGIKPSDTVVEIWPGGGWYTDILAPYLATGGGKLYAAHFDPNGASERTLERLASFDAKYVEGDETFGDVERTALSGSNFEIAPAGSADVVVTFRNAHNFVMGGWADQAFAAFYEALKPGGTLGVVDHRLPEDAEKAREMSSGYLKVSTVRQLAEEAGFVFDGEAEINANPSDDTEHPFGVWTLPPNSRTSDRNGDTPEGFDAAAYRAIGESDRMTLRFKKPIEPAEALLE